jgi:adenosylhomocysteinase
MGARVVVTEVKPTAALKAVLEGCEVMTMDEASKIGDIFITATGMKDVLTEKHFAHLKEGAILCNTGHYDCEINLGQLKAMSKGTREVRPNNEEYTLNNGHKVFVLAMGRLVNLAAAEGHPSEVMDMSFANQYLGMVRLAKEGATMKPTVYDIDPAQDQAIARVKITSMGMSLDALTEEQKKYADDYSAGT